jgi:vacuolar-type H+-ATPase subunit H
MAARRPQPDEPWSLDAYIIHNEAMRRADDRFNDERDRRYTEVKNAEEKALKIKEEADKTALGLQRETQTYKDEKANELRSQIERERGSYATQSDLRGVVEKFEAIVKPLTDFVAASAGKTQQIELTWSKVLGAGGITYLLLHLAHKL